MDPPPVQKLLSWQEKELKKCEEKLERWAQFQQDYEHLRECLSTIADKVSHEVMVPLNSLAFMPGCLIHTNEILVLLGDNWFAERSSKQAQAIVERRLAHCRRMQGDLQKEQEQYLKWMKFTDDLCNKDDYVDIREPYDDTEEEAWQERHHQSLREYHRSKGTAPENNAGDQEVWDVLDRLEVQEEREREIQGASSENEGDGSRRVRWQDESSGHIEFSYLDSGVTQPEETTVGEILSPGDILKAFGGVESSISRSILKTTEVQEQPLTSKAWVEPPDVPPALEETAVVPRASLAEPVGEKDLKPAFTGEVVEHELHTPSEATLDIDVAEIEIPQSLHKPASLFKSRKASIK